MVEKIDILDELNKRKGKFSMKVTAKGRKTGIARSANLWFILFEDGKIYARTRYDKDWLKNSVVNPEVVVTISDFGFKAVAEELTEIQSIDLLKLRKSFKGKYGILDYFVRNFLIRKKERFVRFSFAQ
jgi:hypothetical protein